MRLAARLLHTPVALITILDVDQQTIKSSLGLPKRWQNWYETPLSQSLFRHMVETASPLVIEDARESPLLRDSPAIQDLGIVAYLGVPVVLPGGSVIGSFCVIDAEPRKWTQDDIESLQSLTSCLTTEIELRKAVLEAEEQAEAARRLAESERQFRALFELNPDAVFAFGPDGEFLAANPACEQMTGFSTAELRERTWLELAVPEDLEKDLELFRRTLSGETQHLETAFTHRDGHRVEISVNMVPLIMADQIVGVFGIAEDITVRRNMQAQAELQAYLLDLTVDPTFAWEPGNGIVYWNRGAEEVYGYSREEALGQSPHRLLRSTDPEGTPFMALAVQADGEWQGELKQHTRTDQELIVESHQLLLCDPQGRTLVLESNRDISEHRHAEESLRKQNCALVALGKNPAIASGNRDRALQAITTVAGRTLGVSRVGIWIFDESRTTLRCVCLYELERDTHSRGLVVSAANYPHYFQALEADRVIAADDARLDPRTSELDEPYLRPMGIGAMLDAPIHKGGQVVGVVCHEHTGGPRRWTTEEQAFAAGIADLVRTVCEHVERRRAEEALDEAREQLLRNEVEKKKFTRDLLRAVTQGKLNLVDVQEIPGEGPWLVELPLDAPVNYSLFREHLRTAALNAGLSETEAGELVLAAGEVVTNAIKHGIEGVAAMLVTDDKIVVRVWDHGPGIRPEDLPATVLEAGYSTKVSLGMGFTLLLKLADAIWLATGPEGTVIQFEKRLSPAKPQDPLQALLERFSDTLETDWLEADLGAELDAEEKDLSEPVLSHQLGAESRDSSKDHYGA